MNFVLQSQAGSCPIAPGADLNVAISLLQMSVLGLPLLLALFQFVNDHEYQEPATEISGRTFAYGAVMVLSAFMLWLFYYSAFCIIRSVIGWNSLTSLLFVFLWVLLAIIFMILWIQLEQMAGEGARYSLGAYLFGVVGVVTSMFAESWVTRAVVIGLAWMVVCMGWIDQSIGLEEAGDRVRAAWAERSAARKEDNSDMDERMEGMESVYK